MQLLQMANEIVWPYLDNWLVAVHTGTTLETGHALWLCHLLALWQGICGLTSAGCNRPLCHHSNL